MPCLVFLGIFLITIFISFAEISWPGVSGGSDQTLSYLSGLKAAQALKSNPAKCGYCGWYSPCPKNPSRLCCTDWHNVSCGGGGTDQPPTVSGNVSCTLGQNGWCIGSNAQLVLTASDPQGYAITIDGNLGDANNTTISCNGSCTLPLSSPGSSTATFTVTASTSNLTASSSTDWAYDPDPPVPGLNVSGTGGANGWYISAVNAQAAGTDAISGIAGASLSADGGSEQSSATLSDGVHSVVVTAIDQAGNTASTTYMFNVDTTLPLINLSAAGAPGANNWYVSDVQLNASVSDITSGVAYLDVSIDGGVWQTYTAPIILTDGQHTVQFKAADMAGNVTTTNLQTFKIDTINPVITTNVIGTNGTNSWYTSTVQVNASSVDSGSGISEFKYSVDGGAWQTYSLPLSFSDGQHTIQFQATDQAGNTEQVNQPVLIDSAGPLIEMPGVWTLGRTVTYHVTDMLSGLVGVRVVIEDEDERYAKVSWSMPISGSTFNGTIEWDGKFKDGTPAPPGTYLAWVKAWDAAGNENMKYGKINVPAPFFSFLLPPPVTAPPSPTPQPTATAQPTITQKPAALAPITPLSKPAIVVTSFSAGGVGNDQAAPAPINTLALPLVSSAVAAMAAAAYAASQKQNEALPVVTSSSKKKKKKKDDPGPMSYKQIAKAYAAAKSDFNAALKSAQAEGLSDADAAKLKAQINQTGQIGGALASLNSQVSQIREEKAQKQFDDWLRTGNNPPPGMQDVTEAERLAAYQQTDQYKNYQASLQAYEQQKAIQGPLVSDGYGAVEAIRARAASQPSGQSPATKSWWQQAWDDAKTFVQDKIAQPVQQAVKPLVDRAPALQKVAATAMATAMVVTGASTTYQWAQNLIRPDAFLLAQQRAQFSINELRQKYPPDPNKGTLEYMASHPYEVFSVGSEVLKTFTGIGASYADAFWQQNPTVQSDIQKLAALEKGICPKITNQAWSNGCTAAFYLPASLEAMPFDTASGIVNSFIVDPATGALKLGVLSMQKNPINVLDLANALKQDGLSGANNYLAESFSPLIDVLLIDKQVDSAAVVLLLLAAAMVLPPLAAGIVLGMTGKGLIDVGTAIAQAANKQTVIRYVTSQQVRTQVVGSVLVLALIALGFGNKVTQFRALEDSLSPSQQLAFQELSLKQQLALVNAASTGGASPGTIAFYLDQIGRPGSPLMNMPLTYALHISLLAEQSGRGALLIDYIIRYGNDPVSMKALLDTSPAEFKGIRYIYDATTGDYVDLVDGKFVSAKYIPWPSPNGFAATPVETTLSMGTIIDRYGPLTGRFAGETGTSIFERGMAIGSQDMPYTQLRVIKPFAVPSGPAAAVPEFGATGGGTQYYFSAGIQWWVDNGYLEIVH